MPKIFQWREPLFYARRRFTAAYIRDLSSNLSNNRDLHRGFDQFAVLSPLVAVDGRVLDRLAQRFGPAWAPGVLATNRMFDHSGRATRAGDTCNDFAWRCVVGLGRVAISVPCQPAPIQTSWMGSVGGGLDGLDISLR